MKKILALSFLCVIMLLSPIFTAVTLGDPVGNHLKDHDVWDPATAILAWVHGNPKGYTEGETAAFRVTLDNFVEGQTLWFIVELDLNASNAYAFTGIAPWDTTYQQDGVHLRPPPLENNLTGDRDGFNAAGAVITDVTFLGYSDGYQHWNVTVRTITTGPAYVVYGGHIAASGNAIASGGIVPPDKSASHIQGVFQARVSSPGTGAKTINFNANSITENEPKQSFTVTKITIPHSPTTTFNFTTSATSEPFNLTSGASWNSGNLPPGNYTITELMPEGWDLTNIIIVDPDFGSTIDLESATATIDLDPNEHITIIFINTKQVTHPMGTITVNKVTIPSETETNFDFITSSSEGTFSLSGGNSWSSEELSPGNYTITELVPEGWDLTNIIIVDPDFGSTIDLESATATIDLDPNEHITIIFINTKQQIAQSGLFTVTKLTSPSGASTVFNFVISVFEETFALIDDTHWYSGELPPGTYTITELVPQGWELIGITIEGTSNYMVNLSAGTATIDLDVNEHITIIFVNQEQQIIQTGSFTVTKLTCPSDASTSFNFITSAPDKTFTLIDGNSWNSGDLPPGNYTLTELMPEGWDLTNIIIVDPDGGSRADLTTGTVYIDLDPGETITIIYQNTQQTPKPGTISVTKTTCPAGSSEVFSFVTSTPVGTFSLTDGTTWNSGPLPPGSYSITEIAHADWTITNILIIDPMGASTVDLSTGAAFIDLQPGSHVSIVYQNIETTPQSGSISVIKTTCPTDPITQFTFVTSAWEESFRLTNGEVWNSGALSPGTYVITELAQANWSLSNIIAVDSNGNNTIVDLSEGIATIELQSNNHITLIYQNAQQRPPTKR